MKARMENKGKNSYWRGGRETGYFTDTGYDELNVGTEENPWTWTRMQEININSQP